MKQLLGIALVLGLAAPALGSEKGFLEICELAEEVPGIAATVNSLKKMAVGFKRKTLTCQELYAEVKDKTDLQLPGHTFHYYDVRDVSLLAQLEKVTTLNLRHQKLEYLQPLANLTGLRSLDITGVKTDIAVLRDLKLTELKMTPSTSLPMDILSFLPLESLELQAVEPGSHLGMLPYSLRRLKIEGREISDLSAVSRISLSDLQLFGAPVRDFSFLKNSITTLRTLRVFGAEGVDPKELGRLQQIRNLEMIACKLTSTDFVKNLRTLETVNLGQNELNETFGFASLVNLRKLDLQHNSISDARALLDLFKLEELNLSSNRFYNFDMGYLERLKKLDLSDNQLALLNLHAVDDAEYRLESLMLSNNRLSDVRAGLKPFKRLKELGLTSNKLMTTTGLETLTTLEVLMIGDNKLTDISALSALTRLKALEIYDNPLPKPIVCPITPATACF